LTPPAPPAPPAPPLHRLHDEEVERLLASGEHRRELIALFGEAGYRELSGLARRAAAVRRRGVAVYVLPGLMGSRIGARGRLVDDVIWLDLLELAAGHLTRLALPRGARLSALGVMLLNSLKLKLSLQIAGFDARFHAYDWRLSVEVLARELNARIAADGARETLLVGHSLGGVVARLALATDTGQVARVVQLGSPNFGSFAPVLAMRGVYPTVRKLAALDLHHCAEDLARIVFRTLPALHELLPDAGRAGGPDLFDLAAWPDDGLRPEQQLLAEAAAARERWPEADPRCLHVVGVRQETVTGVERKNGEFHYTLVHDGDGTVPLGLATVPGAAHWYVRESHGGLPNNGKVISAVIDLLRSGSTERLPASVRRARRPATRAVSEAVLRRVAPHKVRWQDLSPDARRRLLEPVVSPEFHGAVAPTALDERRTPEAGTLRTLEIRLVNGGIEDASARALVLGVFRNVDPTGAAAAVDRRLGGAIQEAAQRRMVSGRLGQVSVLPVARGVLMAEFVVFAGLGDFDDFGADAQSFVAGNVLRSLARSGVEDFATVLFGAGSGVPVAAALEQQLDGFIGALETADPDRVTRRITLCETDKRKYAALRRGVARIVGRHRNKGLRLVVDEADLGPARPTRAPAGATARRADPVYLLITLLEHSRREYECRSSLLTAGAKAAVLSGTKRIGIRSLREHLARAESGSLAPRDMAAFGRGIGRLLLAPTVVEGLEAMKRRPLVIVHDREGSRVPWEALRIGDGYPALEGGLSRRYASEGLTVARWREHREEGERLQVLMVVDPTLDLPGATDEGNELARMLRTRNVDVEVLTGAEATRASVLRACAAGRHDILHFAGHGFFDARDPGRSGLVCAGGEVLQGADLDGLGDLPALVFFNACEAARVRRRASGGGRLFAFRRSTSVAEAFLGGGVANFLGTHWPVGDEAAFAFSTRFYQGLLDGAALGECVLEARRGVFAHGSIDWADYVHYGSPEFTIGAAEQA
jgi:pimeloyl-ACP methyl ester carboxylesterase